MRSVLSSTTLLILSCWGSVSAARAVETQWTLAAPDGKLVATLALFAPQQVAEYPADKVRLYYRIEHGPPDRRVEVLPWSPLGIVRSDDSCVDGLSFQSCSQVTTIDETYPLPHGKRSVCHSLAQEQSWRFANAQQTPLEVVLRVANDGVAFRYRFPGSSPAVVTVTSESTGFRLPAEGRAWMTPYQESTQYSPAYEANYLDGIPIGTNSPKPTGWGFPALFQVARQSRWVMLTEAAVDGTYCGCRLAQAAPGGVYRIRFPGPEEGWGHGNVQPSAKLPWAMPWRVVLVGESLAGIVESTLVTDLNPPSRIADVSWIKPGRVAWSWWSDHDSPRDYRQLREFVDLAAEMGWEYFLVDANWTLMDHGNVRELADYAKAKGVGLFLWYNSGGEHNIVSEKPRGCLQSPELRKFEFELLRKWGIRGVKVDFFQSDKQEIMALYHDILRDAAEAQIMVNFHGCTLPRGWERTWPHLMSMEGVRGEENYTFAADFPVEAPRYNTIVPFTRNVVGPMDYTPCAFTDDKYPHLTTNAHELALAVVFESALLHFADRVSAYRQLPDAPKTFLRELPVTWDETRYLAGHPGRSVVLARRKGDVWYLGALNGQKEPLRLSLPLGFLGAGKFAGILIGDGNEPRSFASREVRLQAGESFELNLAPYGGCAIRLQR
ncbi:MAG: glycoside hydrolase family 97 protein [Planctomycetota bacterium]|nr:glycoside hydrolase family 97 protein [Planctomycetota bacterium]